MDLMHYNRMVWGMNMSKESYCFEAESVKTAFLAGIVDVLSDNLSRHCVDFNAFDADVFYAPDQDISQLTDAVKRECEAISVFGENWISQRK